MLFAHFFTHGSIIQLKLDCPLGPFLWHAWNLIVIPIWGFFTCMKLRDIVLIKASAVELKGLLRCHIYLFKYKLWIKLKLEHLHKQKSKVPFIFNKACLDCLEITLLDQMWLSLWEILAQSWYKIISTKTNIMFFVATPIYFFESGCILN